MQSTDLLNCAYLMLAAAVLNSGLVPVALHV